MKKIIGILGIIVIAMAMSFNANAIKSSGTDLNLATLIGINNANAEECNGGSCTYTTYFNGQTHISCSSCCPAGKTPNCTAFGCTCTSS